MAMIPLAIRRTGGPMLGDRGWRRYAVLGLDLACWACAFVVAAFIHDATMGTLPVLGILGAAMVIQAGTGLVIGTYRNCFRPATFDEAGALALSVAATGLLVLSIERLAGKDLFYGRVVALATGIAGAAMLGHRYLRRLRSEARSRAAKAHCEPVLVLGAGEGGERAIRAMSSVKSSPYRPVALVDDDPSKRGLRISGIKVEGSTDQLAELAKRHRASSVLIAIPSASAGMLRTLHHRIRDAGLETLVVPPVQRLVGSGSPREFERYRAEDVLRRQVVYIDREKVRDLVHGCRVLVTGAGGSIGSELARQLAALAPAELVLVDRDDSLLHATMASLPPPVRHPSSDLRCFSRLADLRDPDRLREVFGIHRPHVVFHAAALKHVPALEEAPSEAWKTNVLGTANILAACEEHNVLRFVNISTDKAADPANVLGYSKRITERLTAAAAYRARQPYVSVRFGNVIGSRGSVIETFGRQIAEGGPVTVTHPDVTRYFMAVREAVLLTMQAAAVGRAGETLVLDMGEPVRVFDVAQQLVDRAERPIEIRITGLRPGEKLHEQLLAVGETPIRPFHPMIDHVRVPALGLQIGLDRCRDAGLSPLTTEGLAFMARVQLDVDRVTLPHAEHDARRGLTQQGAKP